MPYPDLIEWVAQQHKGQLVRGTAEPYHNHLLRVAEMSGAYVALGYECGLCHDLIEKTDITPQMLFRQLLQFQLSRKEAELITSVVIELTDVYTKSAYPELKKPFRKQKEEQRLTMISSLAQTVKYADLYDNINWMLEHDRNRAPAYLQRKKELILNMDKGNPLFRQELINYISVKLL